MLFGNFESLSFSYFDVFEKAPDAMMILSFPDITCLHVNQIALEKYGLSSKQELIGSDPMNLHFKYPKAEEIEHFKQKLLEKGYCENEILYKKTDGTTFWGLLTATMLDAEKGLYLSRVIDITERKVLADELKESDRERSNLFNSIDEGLLQLNNENQIIFANNKFLQLVACDYKAIKGLTADEVLFDETGNNVAQLQMLSMDTKGLKNQYECQYRKKGGETLWLWTNGSPVYNNEGDITGSFIICNDITERKQMEIKLVSAILETQESERSRLSEELHDGLGQVLTAIKLNLNALKPNAQDSKIIIYDNLTSLIEQAIEEARNISYNLMPKSIRDFGLVHAVQTMVERVNKAKSIYIAFNCEDDFNMDFQFNINAYRMIQEALNNSMKYSKAKNILLEIVKEDDTTMRITVRDRGKGFDVGTAMIKGGLGLKNMVRRAEFVGGSCSIASQVDQGTTVEFLLPIRRFT